MTNILIQLAQNKTPSWHYVISVAFFTEIFLCLKNICHPSRVSTVLSNWNPKLRKLMLKPLIIMPGDIY